MRLHFETLWQKFIASIYILSFLFSLAPLTITVIAISHWPSRIYEAYGPTAWVFSTFGLFWGALIIGLENIGTTFVPPILILKILRYSGEGEIAKRVRFLGWAFIEAHGFSRLTLWVLAAYNDAVVTFLVLSGAIGQNPVTVTFILSLSIAVFIITFVLSFSIRTIRHIKSMRLQKKASK